jgi:hypothetical protein
MNPLYIRLCCVGLLCLDASLVCLVPEVALALWFPAAAALALAFEGEGIR